MGFVPQRTAYKLVFEDPKYDGLEVVMTANTVGDVLDDMMGGFSGLDIQALQDAAKRNDASAMAKHVALIVETTMGAYEAFVKCLVRWNIETEDGVAVPTTMEGVKTQDTDLVRDVMTAWRAATTEVPQNLDPGSDNGKPSVEASLPMEPSLPSPPS